MSGRRITSIVATLLLAGTVESLAQQPPLASGDRIRVTAPDLGDNQVVGTLDGIEAQRLVMRFGEEGSLSLDLASLTKLEVHRGQRSAATDGAAIGLLAGSAMTALFLASFCGGDTLCQSDEILRAFTYIAVPTGLIGAFIGSWSTVDRWEEVPLAAIQVGFGEGSGLTVVARVAF